MIALLIAASLFAPAPAPASPPTKTVAGKCTFGDVAQVGKRVAITGNAGWTAVGHLTAGGRLRLTWTNTASGRIAFGMYEIEDGRFVGHWGWADEAELLEEDICGEIFQESIERISEP